MAANGNMQSPQVITIRQTQTCCPGHVFIHSSTPINETIGSSHLPDYTAPHPRRRISSKSHKTNLLSRILCFIWFDNLSFPFTRHNGVKTCELCISASHINTICKSLNEGTVHTEAEQSIAPCRQAATRQHMFPIRPLLSGTYYRTGSKEVTYCLPPTLVRSRETLWRSMVN